MSLLWPILWESRHRDTSFYFRFLKNRWRYMREKSQDPIEKSPYWKMALLKNGYWKIGLLKRALIEKWLLKNRLIEKSPYWKMALLKNDSIEKFKRKFFKNFRKSENSKMPSSGLLDALIFENSKNFENTIKRLAWRANFSKIRNSNFPDGSLWPSSDQSSKK